MEASKSQGPCPKKWKQTSSSKNAIYVSYVSYKIVDQTLRTIWMKSSIKSQPSKVSISLKGKELLRSLGPVGKPKGLAKGSTFPPKDEDTCSINGNI